MENLQEEIKRIKDLFTEEKLYGNSINEGCTSCTAAEMEEELEKDGYSVYKRGTTSSACDSTINTTPHLKCVKDWFDTDSNFKNTYQIFPWKQGCVIHVVINGKKLPFLTNRGKSNLLITFFEKGTFKGENKAFAITVTFDTPFDLPNPVKHFTEKPYTGIEKIQIRGVYDDNCKIKSLWMVMVKDENGENTVLTEMVSTQTQNDTIKKIIKIKIKCKKNYY